MNSRQLRKHKASIHNTELERLKNRTPEEVEQDFQTDIEKVIKSYLEQVKRELY